MSSPFVTAIIPTKAPPIPAISNDASAPEASPALAAVTAMRLQFGACGLGAPTAISCPAATYSTLAPEVNFASLFDDITRVLPQETSTETTAA